MWLPFSAAAAVPKVASALSRQPLRLSLTLLRRRLDFVPVPCLIIRPGLQRLGLGSDGFFSLASELDAAVLSASTGVMLFGDSARARPYHVIDANAQLFNFHCLSDRDCACKPKAVKISRASKEDR